MESKSSKVPREEQIKIMQKQPKLAQQDLDTLDPAKVTPLSPEVISRQATINIGTIGHVAHGKSTVVKAISGIHTVRFHNEKIRNITIKLGYANAKIFKCPECKVPECFQSFGSEKEDYPPCTYCKKPMTLLRHISFVDCPGHDILMATMLGGVAVMDAALLLVAANETCPQPQTSEHLAAVEMMKLQNIIIIQNKIDIVPKESAVMQQYEEIKKFVSGTRAEKAPIVPISAQLKYNIDVVCDYLCRIPIPVRDFTSSPRLIIIRSFDVNKPGDVPEALKGGVAGGSVLKGILRIGDEVEIRPGIISKDSTGATKCTPIQSVVVSLLAEKNDLLYAVPGGLIGVGLKVDPTLTRSDRLVGHVLGLPGSLPAVVTEIDVNYYLLRRLLGVRSEGGKTRQEKVVRMRKGELLLVNIGSTSTGANVLEVHTETIKLQLLGPVCTQEGEKVALSRKVANWRLIGWGEITKVYPLK